MEFIEALGARRSVRRYSDRAVEPQKLHDLFEAVRLSPSWSNMQCPRFIVVRDPEVRQRISELSSVEAIIAPMGYKANPARKALAEAPLVVVACAHPAESGRIRGQDYYLVDVGIAAQSMMLSAADQGLATVFVGIFDEDPLRQMLGMPDDVRVVGLFPLGYPLQDPLKEGKGRARPPRKPVSEIVFDGRWGDGLDPSQGGE